MRAAGPAGASRCQGAPADQPHPQARRATVCSCPAGSCPVPGKRRTSVPPHVQHDGKAFGEEQSQLLADGRAAGAGALRRCHLLGETLAQAQLRLPRAGWLPEACSRPLARPLSSFGRAYPSLVMHVPFHGHQVAVTWPLAAVCGLSQAASTSALGTTQPKPKPIASSACWWR